MADGMDPVASGQSDGGERLRVIVVDDDPPLRGLIVRLLDRDGGYEIVGQSGDGAEAVEQIARLTPDVVLLDLHLPGLDGWEVLPIICRESPRSMVAILSGLDATVEAAGTFAVGAFAYLEKSALGPTFAGEVRRLRGMFERALAGETVWSPSGPDRVLR